MAWDPDGNGVWYESGELGSNTIRMLTPEGDHEIVEGFLGQMRLLDTSSDGRALISRSDARVGIRCLPPGESTERELSWLDFSDINDMTSDGRTMLLTEFGEAGGQDNWSVYLRRTDGSPAVRLADGQGLALSPDGKTALTFQLSDPPQIVVVPTGAGEPVRLPNPGFSAFQGGDWHPDGERVVFAASEGGASRIYIQDLEGGAPKTITPEGVEAGFGQRIVSPDGKWILGDSVEDNVVIYPIEGGEPRIIAVPAGTRRPAGWSTDSSSIYVFTYSWGEPNQIYKILVSDGETRLWRELNHPDPAGILFYWGFQIAEDERSYCYSYMRDLSALYLVEGLR
jgi:dipeptidyl aminopeptidase/acylaminoacyl peptidase